MEHYDYEAVLPEVWRFLTAWYGCQPDLVPILRPVCYDRKSNNFFVDLYLDVNFSNVLGEDDVPFSDRSMFEEEKNAN